MPAFSKQYRLLKRSDFSRCYSDGKRHFTSHFIIFVLPTAAETWRFGLAVSRKVGGAVQRNRIKRLLREFFRLHRAIIPAGHDFAVVCKKGGHPERLNYPGLEKELLSLFTGLLGKTGKRREPHLPSPNSGNTADAAGSASLGSAGNAQQG
ncbi:MAG: ribonuclease P protein component [Deltaproteobacteria bacterium]|jgi:ribonuclease P protein component|nr:ribonuclease P protein component [Deltaproteobacteria bacterium]